MITETGKVIAISQIQGEAVAHIECISKSACSSCHNKNCGVGVVSKAFSDKSHSFEVPFKDGMEVDSFVELQINNGDLIKSAALLYLVPLISFISSALIIKSFFNINELLLISLSSAITASSFYITRCVAKKQFPTKTPSPLIRTIISK